MKKGNLNIATISARLGGTTKTLRAYRAFIFFLIVAAFYGFILWRINAYSNAPANQSQESARVAAQPHVDKSTVQKILTLQNNSVSVQALFNQARQNPFQE